MLMDSEILTLFSVTEVLCNLHGQFYVKLRERMSPQTWDVSQTCLGDIFFSYAPRILKAYKPYINNFDDALALLNNEVLWKRKEWVQFFRAAAQTLPDLNITGLGHFLIQPLQRVPRYIVLLESLLEFTPASHPDAPTLGKAISKVHEITEQLSESLKLAENANKLVSIDLSIGGLSHSLLDTSRRFIQEGAAFMVVAGVDQSSSSSASPPEAAKGTNVYLFLFNDVLVLAKRLKRVESPQASTMFRSRSNTVSSPAPHSTRFRAIFSLSLVGSWRSLVRNSSLPHTFFHSRYDERLRP